jgi:hypothetical protein
VAESASRQILCTAFDKGCRHDFKLFKDSKVYLKEESKYLVDTGYQGIRKIHGNSEHPVKKMKKRPLTTADKAEPANIVRENND